MINSTEAKELPEESLSLAEHAECDRSHGQAQTQREAKCTLPTEEAEEEVNIFE